VLPDLRTTGRFALSVLGSGDQALMGPFLKRLAPGATPFDGLVLARTPAGLHVLADALAWLECRVTGEHAAGDHVVFFGAVDSAALLREGDPRVHLRKNGLAY
jgi:flavin reductase (DIM6/NTAB) family NADH-FMN oxidoreductase RutF